MKAKEIHFTKILLRNLKDPLKRDLIIYKINNYCITVSVIGFGFGLFLSLLFLLFNSEKITKDSNNFILLFGGIFGYILNFIYLRCIKYGDVINRTKITKNN